MLTIKELKEKVSGITDEKMCSGISDELLIDQAKLAWGKAGGFKPSKSEDPEWKFWWELLAFRYANLLMRKIERLGDLELADELFEVISTSLNSNQEITHAAYLSGIYRLAVLSRIRAIQPENKK